MDAGDLLETFFAAMTPVGELRFSIPLAIYTLDMPWYQAYPVSVLGNMAPVFFLLPGLHYAARLLHRYPTPLTRLLDWRAESLQRAYGGRYARYGPAFLVVLVAIPLPITGAWTGSLASWVFGIPARRAIPPIGLGVLIAGGIVTFLTESGVRLGGLIAGE